jgi:probable F420-dependent oxidoreductase
VSERPYRVGIAFTAETPLAASEIIECARHAERRDIDALWVAEGRSGDAFATLAAVAANTTSLRLGSGIVPVYTRSPWLIAMAAAVVDNVSRGRFMLGLGPSHKAVVEQRHGLRFEKPLQRVRETTAIVRLAMTGRMVDYDGEIFTLRGAQLAVAPQRPVPIYLAAVGPRMLELAGEIADGVLLIFPTPAYIAQVIERLRTGAGRAARGIGEVQRAAYVFTCVSTARASAIDASRRTIAVYGRRPAYREHFAQHGFAPEAAALEQAWTANDPRRAMNVVTDAMVDNFSASGTPDEVAAKIDLLGKSGLDEVVLYAYGTDCDVRRAVVDAIDAVGR